MTDRHNPTLRWFYPLPSDHPKVYPKQIPKTVVPSYIGEPGQILNLLMYRGAGDVVIDYSGQGNHGNLTGGEWRDWNQACWAIWFDGGDHYADVDVDLSPYPEGTVILWYRAEVLEDYDRWFSYFADVDNRTCIYEDGGAYRVYISVGGTLVLDETAGSSKTDVWTRITLKSDGSNVYLYENGSLVNSWAETNWWDDIGSGTFYLNRYGGAPGYSIEGAFKLLRVFSVSKSDDFVSRSFEQERVLFGV